MCGLVGGGQLGPAGQTGDAPDLRGRLFQSLFDFLKKSKEDDEAALAPSLTDPLAPMPDTLLRRNTDIVSEIGVNPAVAARQRRQRTLGIAQLGVPLPGRLSGGLHLPD